MKKGLLTIGMTALAAVTLVGCPSGSSDSDVETITFISHKTDWGTNGKWDEYITKFSEKHSDIKVEVQTTTDYAGQMKTRMNSKEYGDVLMIPGDISPKDYGNFFKLLGDTEELSEKYLGPNDRSYEGVQYGISSQMNVTGLIVNKEVFEDAGITEFPKTTEDFIAALKKIKENSSSIVPLYTNYAAGWILSNWNFTRTGVSGDADFTNEMTPDTSLFGGGDTIHTTYNTLYIIAKEGLIESDPTTSDWEQPKVDLANGKVAVMVLGSWAVPQVQEANENNADNITFKAFPVTASDGKQYMPIGGDYNYSIDVNSKYKKVVRKFINWMVNESDYAVDNGGIPTVKGVEYPKVFQDSQDAGVELIEENPVPGGKGSLFSDINNESELGIGSTDTEKQRIIDAAVGNSKESFDDIMKDFNTRWANAIRAVSDN